MDLTAAMNAASVDIGRLDIKDTNNAGKIIKFPYLDSVDSGNNTGWFAPLPPPPQPSQIKSPEKPNWVPVDDETLVKPWLKAMIVAKAKPSIILAARFVNTGYPEYSKAAERAFLPKPEEIAGIALFHIAHVKDPIVSFGQGCEGEPLLAGDVIEKAIRIIRRETARGTINMNTNGGPAVGNQNASFGSVTVNGTLTANGSVIVGTCPSFTFTNGSTFTVSSGVTCATGAGTGTLASSTLLLPAGSAGGCAQRGLCRSARTDQRPHFPRQSGGRRWQPGVGHRAGADHAGFHPAGICLL